MIVATAGHIDHGKTTLVRALSGIDTDRLPEEKARGISIDLGFAHWRTPGGADISFVDVPGHERFIKNMLAGVACIDAALLVVAADDGPMPQTREHLEILELLDVPRLAVALTKIDRVDEAGVAGVVAVLTDLLASTPFAGAPILPMAAPAGIGLAALVDALDDMARTRRLAQRGGLFRMAVDRAFIVTGEGLIVTGSIASGNVATGDEVRIAPRGVSARVRGIRVADSAREAATAGERCAFNLAGPAIDRTSARRGDWLLAPALDRATSAIDVCLSARLMAGAPWQERAVHAFLGTADVPARLHRLSSEADAPAPFARLRLAQPVSAIRSDRIVLRDAGNLRTLGGAIVLDPFPERVQLKRASRIEYLAALEQGSPREAMMRMAGSAAEGADLALLQCVLNLDDAAVGTLAEDPALVRVPAARGAPRVLRRDDCDAVGEAIESIVDQFHREQPHALGPTRQMLAARLGPRARTLVFEVALEERLQQRRVLRAGAALHRPGHRPTLADADAVLWQRMRPLIEAAGVRPPRAIELAERLALPVEAVQALLDRVAAAGDVFRVAPNRCFLPEQLAQLAGIAVRLASEQPQGVFTAAAFKDASGIGRNLTIELLEYFDRVGFTRRRGNERHVKGAVGAFFDASATGR